MKIFKYRDQFLFNINSQSYLVKWMFQQNISEYNCDDDIRVLYSKQHQIILLIRKEFTTHTIALYAINQDYLIQQLQQSNNTKHVYLQIDLKFEFQSSIHYPIISFFEKNDLVYVLFSNEIYEFSYPQFKDNNLIQCNWNKQLRLQKELIFNLQQQLILYKKSKIHQGKQSDSKLTFFKVKGRVQNRIIILNKIKFCNNNCEQIRKQKSIKLPILYQNCPIFNEQEIAQYQIQYLNVVKSEINMRIILIQRQNYRILEYYGKKMSKLENMTNCRFLDSNISLLEPVYSGRNYQIIAYERKNEQGQFIYKNISPNNEIQIQNN